MTHHSLLDMLVNAALTSPSVTALVQQDRRLSYADLVCAVAQTASHESLCELRGRRVALIADNSIEFVIALFSCYAAGAQVVPIGTVLTQREVGEIFADSEPTAIIVAASAREKLAGLFSAWKNSRVLELESLVRLKQASTPLDELDGCVRNLATGTRDTDMAVLLYTGGTTGRPKGVPLTHRQLLANLDQRQHLVPYTEAGEVILCFMPMSHTFSLHLCVHGAIHTRNTTIVMDHYHPSLVLEAIRKERVTCLPAGPTALIGILDVFKSAPTDVSSLELIISGSAPLPLQTLLELETALSCTVCEGYGQTEAGSALSFNPRFGKRKQGTVGVPFPGTVFQVVDIDSGQKIETPGVAGEICARGPQVMLGYLNRPEETASTLKDGWLHTGDIGFFDDEGYFTICDRRKDMVIVSGYNVFPREIDDVLMAFPDVREAASIGVSDDYRGEVIHSFVVAGDGGLVEADLFEYCKKNLARYKWPARISVVECLPKTSVGKIDKKTLRAGL